MREHIGWALPILTEGNMYDAAERLAEECETSFTVLGRGGAFVLIDNSCKDDSTQEARARLNGWTYCGVLGLNDGVPRVDCDPHPDSIYTMMFAGIAFCRLVADTLRHPVTGDSTNWLRQLHTLQDTRVHHA